MALTRADLGRIVYDAFSLLLTRYTTVRTPDGTPPALTDVVDSQQRYNAAVEALQELSGVRVGIQPSVPAESTQTRIASLSLLVEDIKKFVTPLMKGQEYEIRIPSKTVVMRNAVSYKNYTVIANVQTVSRTYKFAINEQGQYVLSESAYWEAV